MPCPSKWLNTIPCEYQEGHFGRVDLSHMGLLLAVDKPYKHEAAVTWESESGPLVPLEGRPS